jgi:hypothetical protein
MTYTPEDEAWRGPSATPSHDDLPPTTPGAGGRSQALPLVAIGAVVALVVAAVLVVVMSSGGGGGEQSGGELGGAVATVTTTSAPSNAGTVATTTSTTAEGGGSGDAESDHAPAGAGLPAVTIPAESTAPTTIPGSEPNSIPTDLDGGEAPQWGTIVVDLDEGGYLDFPVHLRAEQELQLLSLADDGVLTEIEVFAPDGSSEGWWAGGEPEVINGLEWYLPDEPLPATGTYVIRVIHTGGSHEPFALGFFGTT